MFDYWLMWRHTHSKPHNPTITLGFESLGSKRIPRPSANIKTFDFLICGVLLRAWTPLFALFDYSRESCPALSISLFSLCQSVCVCVSLSLFLSPSLFFSHSHSLSLFIFPPSVSLSISLSVTVCVSLSFSLFFYISSLSLLLSLFIYLSIYLSSLCWSVYFSLCFSVSLSLLLSRTGAHAWINFPLPSGFPGNFHFLLYVLKAGLSKLWKIIMLDFQFLHQMVWHLKILLKSVGENQWHLRMTLWKLLERLTWMGMDTFLWTSSSK